MFAIIAPEGLNGDEYREMRKRFKQWAPIRGALQSAFLETQRRYYAASPVGEMKSLGPKILAGDLASTRTSTATFGVKSEYAEAYDNWREEKGLGPLLLVDDALVTQVVDIIAAYVLRGEGAMYKQRKPRYR